MAKSSNPLIGNTSGSVGGVTFSKWKNLNIIKEKPTSVANPNTVNQQMRRNMMTTLVAAGRLLLPIADLGFIAYRNVMSQFNAFIKYNYGTFIGTGVPPLITEDFTQLSIAKGPLTPTAITSVTGTDSSADVVFVFPNTADAPDQALTDLAYAVAVIDDGDEVAYQIVGAARSTGTITVTMPNPVSSGENVKGYLFFTRADGSVASDSTYASSTVS